jgi:hypothetical protein
VSHMSQADKFRQYAKDAMRDARQSKSEKEKEALIDLAHAWAQAAFRYAPADPDWTPQDPDHPQG